MDDTQKTLVATLAAQIFIAMTSVRPNPAFGMTQNEVDRSVYMARRIVKKAFSSAPEDDVALKPVVENTPAAGTQNG